MPGLLRHDREKQKEETIQMERPGAFAITDRAMEICHFDRGAKLLEIGCGEGETLEHLEKDYGYDMTAIDISLEKVRLAKERGLKADVRFGDGEFLDDFLSNTFDGVVMECVLSLINKPDEALHEIWCVLKKGGRLFLSDVYYRNPDPDIVAAVARKAEEDAHRPHEYGECNDECADEHSRRMVSFRYDGKFFLEPLRKYMREIGYRIIALEDRSDDLAAYTAEKMMNGEEVASCMKNPKKAGYFFLVAEKA